MDASYGQSGGQAVARSRRCWELARCNPAPSAPAPVQEDARIRAGWARQEAAAAAAAGAERARQQALAAATLEDNRQAAGWAGELA